MTHSSVDQEIAVGGRRGVTEFVPPLVSVIIVNHNYGRFLRDAVTSVFRQRYRRFECVLVDNASTDDSHSVMDELAEDFPELKIIYRASNDGQCVAAAEALGETRGQYVVFLDADDVLLPEFIGTHLYVALSAYPHVGFTCCDMAQACGDEIVVTTSMRLRELGPSAKCKGQRLMRPVSRELCDTGGLTAVEEGELVFVERDDKEWRWTATSAFMFRRDAVAGLLSNPRLPTLRVGLDVYLGRGVNAITGSILLDRALAIYRMHGSNVFSRHAHLENCLNFEPGSRFDQNELARRELIDFWFRNAPAMIRRLRIKEDFITSVAALNDLMPRLTDAEGRSYASAQLLRHFNELREAIGLYALLDWCVRLRVSPFAVLKKLLVRRD